MAKVCALSQIASACVGGFVKKCAVLSFLAGMGRGPKTSRFLGVRVREGHSIAVELRINGRPWQTSGMPTDRHAAVAHDLIRVLHKLYPTKKMNLNFGEYQHVLEMLLRQHKMERFRVLPVEEENGWAPDKEAEFMALVEDAVNRISSGRPASVLADLEAAEAARKDLQMGVEAVFPSDPSGGGDSCTPYFTRESEKDIPPPAEGRLSVVAGMNHLPEYQSSALEAQIGHLQAEFDDLHDQVSDILTRAGDILVRIRHLQAERAWDTARRASAGFEQPECDEGSSTQSGRLRVSTLGGSFAAGTGDPAQANDNLEMRMNRSLPEADSGDTPVWPPPRQLELTPPSSRWDYGVSPMQQQHPNQGPWMMQQQGMQPPALFRGDPPGSYPPSMTTSDDFGDPFPDSDLRSTFDGFDI